MWVIVLLSCWRQKAQCIVCECAIAAWYIVSVRILHSYSTGEGEALERGALTVIMWESGDSPYLHQHLTFRNKAQWLASSAEEPTLLTLDRERWGSWGVSASYKRGNEDFEKSARRCHWSDASQLTGHIGNLETFVEKRKAKNDQDRYTEREGRPLLTGKDTAVAIPASCWEWGA